MPDTAMHNPHVLDQPLPAGVPAPGHGVIVTHLLIVTDQAGSKAFHRDVLGGDIVRDADPVMIRLHNSWLIFKAGGGPTPDKPDVIAAPPQNSDVVGGQVRRALYGDTGTGAMTKWTSQLVGRMPSRRQDRSTDEGGGPRALRIDVGW